MSCEALNVVQYYFLSIISDTGRHIIAGVTMEGVVCSSFSITNGSVINSLVDSTSEINKYISVFDSSLSLQDLPQVN